MHGYNHGDPSMLLRYSLSDFEMVPIPRIITGITFAFTFHMRWVSIMRHYYYIIIIIIIISSSSSSSSSIHGNIQVALLKAFMQFQSLALSTHS